MPIDGLLSSGIHQFALILAVAPVPTRAVSECFDGTSASAMRPGLRRSQNCESSSSAVAQTQSTPHKAHHHSAFLGPAPHRAKRFLQVWEPFGLFHAHDEMPPAWKNSEALERPAQERRLVCHSLAWA